MKIDSRYSAVHRLADGTRVRIRLLAPSDRDKLRDGFRRLSPQARYRRFFAPMPRLSEAMLRRLMEVDGADHVAIVAAGPTPDGGIDEILGVARFVRSKDSLDAAEASVAVIDAMHRRGIGRLLLTALVAAARERGIAKFRAHVLPDNEPMKLLLRALDEHAAAKIEDGLRVYELALPEASPEAVAGDPMYRFLKLAAEGLEDGAEGAVARRSLAASRTAAGERFEDDRRRRLKRTLPTHTERATSAGGGSRTRNDGRPSRGF